MISRDHDILRASIARAACRAGERLMPSSPPSAPVHRSAYRRLPRRARCGHRYQARLREVGRAAPAEPRAAWPARAPLRSPRGNPAHGSHPGARVSCRSHGRASIDIYLTRGALAHHRDLAPAARGRAAASRLRATLPRRVLPSTRRTPPDTRTRTRCSGPWPIGHPAGSGAAGPHTSGRTPRGVGPGEPAPTSRRYPGRPCGPARALVAQRRTEFRAFPPPAFCCAVATSARWMSTFSASATFSVLIVMSPRPSGARAPGAPPFGSCLVPMRWRARPEQRGAGGPIPPAATARRSP